MKVAGYVAAVSAVVLIVGLAASPTVTGLGVIGLIIAAGLAFHATGRVGPETAVKNSASCCGCSCVVLALIIPGASIAVWFAHGLVASIAAVPASVAVVWAMSITSKRLQGRTTHP
jgi:hypothetical protein